jgi:phosphoribosylglycinamide formyltransferase-1
MTARIAILASGNGSNAEHIIRYFKGHKNISVALVLSNNPNAAVLDRAASLRVPSLAFTRAQFSENGEVIEWLHHEGITHIVLAGFLWLVPADLLAAYQGRIINIHPALLPRHGGKGMYGARVHEAVKVAGDTETGITIHLVNAHYDEGEVLFRMTCPVDKADSPQDIADKVHALEYKYYPTVIEGWILKDQASTA